MTSPLGGIQHVGIATDNLEESLAFYERVFQIKATTITSTPRARLALLDLGNAVLELLEYKTPKELESIPSRGQQRVHVCLQVHGLLDLYGRLTEQGMQFEDAPAQHEIDGLGAFTNVFLRDPSGVRLELFEPLETAAASRSVGL